MSQNEHSTLHASLNSMINQFWAGMIQHRSHVAILAALGYSRLAAAMEERIADEPETIAALQKRLLDLGGTLGFESFTPTLGTDARAILALDLKVQEQGVPVLSSAAKLASDLADTATRRLIENIIVDEDEHLNWLKEQISLLERLGDQLFLAHHA